MFLRGRIQGAVILLIGENFRILFGIIWAAIAGVWPIAVLVYAFWYIPVLVYTGMIPVYTTWAKTGCPQERQIASLWHASMENRYDTGIGIYRYDSAM